MKCPSCNHELKDTAKFCGKCGTKIEQSSNENKCIECGVPLKVGAKFCGKCGAQQSPKPEKPEKPEESTKPNQKGYVTWEIQPGQIAMRLNEKIFSEYSMAKGVVIPEGYLAMVLVGGKLQSMLNAGMYKFDSKRRSTGQRILDFFSNFFSSDKSEKAQQQKNIDAISQAVEKHIPIEIVVCRSSDFSLPFVVKQVPTSAIKVDIGILVSIQISNLLQLYKKYLLDRTVLGAETLEKELSPYLETAIKETIRSFSPDAINLNSELKYQLASKLSGIFSEKFPFIQFIDIIKIEAGREELQRLERLSEEMYLSEQELDQLTRRNEFMNRLTQEQNTAEIQNAQNATEFNQRLAAINRDNLLTEEEMANLQRDIAERSEDHQIERAMAVEMLAVQHQASIQEAHIKMEEELGTRLFNLQLDRQRTSDDYADERRRKEMEMDKEEQLGQLDILRQAQNIRQEREQAEHSRKLEAEELSHQHETEKLNIYAGMTAEQIMVANPKITEEAAKAMAEKFKAEAQVAANDSRAADAQEQTRMMKEFMEQQMQAVRDMSSANAQAMAGIMNAKEREIERTQRIVDKNEDRYADVVRENIRAGNTKSTKACPSCGSEVGDEPFCGECGTRL